MAVAIYTYSPCWTVLTNLGLPTALQTFGTPGVDAVTSYSALISRLLICVTEKNPFLTSASSTLGSGEAGKKNTGSLVIFGAMDHH